MQIDAALVRRLIAAQFPQWAALPVERVAADGWDNRTFRLGDRMSVRLPSAEGYVAQVEKEHRWLPRLAPHLPLPVPRPIGRGAPAAGYPFPWSVYEWIDGEPSSVGNIAGLARFARDLAGFLSALRAIDATGGPPPGPHNFFRGGPLTVYDEEARDALRALEGRIDTTAARGVWEAALAAPWRGDPVWFHGDISTGNLLVDEHGTLSAVIDFGTAGVGDPACDLVIAWTLFDEESRAAFRERMPADDAMWARARGWALWKAMIVAAGLAGTTSPPPGRSWRVIDAVVADAGR